MSKHPSSSPAAAGPVRPRSPSTPVRVTVVQSAGAGSPPTTQQVDLPLDRAGFAPQAADWRAEIVADWQAALDEGRLGPGRPEPDPEVVARRAAMEAAFYSAGLARRRR